ncbi:hypothetical protein A2773_02695 [Candidatus Gottesmanbacteria bacterium RIFCSPHIGHO2_01_FULL_39_10]|uniref:Uncharacterized protein n=1 Tax=Candidatus Gottesmanbacteria bacterium RIFCSPHIGHO2_01_FULL_39_10 TaxID=1798375 RepID=A0A1F5ZRF2_9BACT|nr:MAG: hypothetical protein A2773_02695 [Candidatus Gottesmanbacteria bacterium RIFCSPHIGHO2_01_FULL_39_10]
MRQIYPKRFLRNLTRKLLFEKRERLGIATLLLSFGLTVSQLIWPDFRLTVVVFITVLTYPLSFWAIREDIRGIERITLFILPVFFTLSVSLFYFLLPVRWLTRLPTVVFFAIGMYAILLSENIFNVAANRSIQLLRAAQSVGFLLTLVVFFLFVNIIFSFHLAIPLNFLLLFVISSILFYQLFWSTLLTTGIGKKLVVLSIICGFSIGELAYVFSFWPIKTTIMALFMSAVFYSIGGIVQESLLEKLFKGVVREYMWVTILIFILVVLGTRWG